MSNSEWLSIVISFLSGSVVATLIKHWLDGKKNRKPIVFYAFDYRSVFSSNEKGDLISGVVVKSENLEYTFLGLGYITLEIQNSNQRDHSQFTFGLTLPAQVSIINADFQSSDRHHAAYFDPTPSFDVGTSKIDIKVSPFNRREKYSLSFLVKFEKDEVAIADVHISSAEAVDLKRISTENNGESIKRMLEDPILKILFALFFPSIYDRTRNPKPVRDMKV